MHKTRLSHVTKQAVALIENDNTTISDIYRKVPPSKKPQRINGQEKNRGEKRNCLMTMRLACTLKR